MKAELIRSETGVPSLDDKWDRRFLELAHVVSKWSKDRTKVGAVIVDRRRVVSLGFNGFPAGVEDLPELYEDRDTKLLMIVHAETNAIVSARELLSGCTIYTSFPPCAGCAGNIIQAGIKRVVCSPRP
jgi:dCMP deaminase